jgi:hypothetical protein
MSQPMHPEPVAVILQVTAVLESLQIPYVIGGSLASTIYGRLRTTMDVDILAVVRLDHIDPLVQMLGDDFYHDKAMMGAAIEQRSVFSLIHLRTMFKVDIFIPKRRSFDSQQLARGARRVIATDPERKAFVASPEDTILAKLEWYRLGGEVSERQWTDVLSILEIQGGRLDRDYLQRWAVTLNVSDLLTAAWETSGQPGG